jgi:tRNA (guanine-N7-)-methyltransferase
MGKNKLKKFSELEGMEFVFQYPYSRLASEGFPLRGRWNEEFFHNSNPIVLELGCGKGEYTVGLARANADVNYIGIDIKGARMWTGARQARDEALPNVAFIRTNIELLSRFFAPGEVSAIWITFPDPQMKKVRKRLTSTTFMELYRSVITPGGIVNLKSDSPFLSAYTSMMAEHNCFEILGRTDDLHNDPAIPSDHPLRTIRTHYEQQWLDRGLSIKYISFRLPADSSLEEPPGAEDLEHDTYRSYSRGYIQMPQLMDDTED